MKALSADRARIVAPPPAIYLGILAIGLALEWFWPTRPLGWAVRLGLGLPILLGGVLGLAWAVRAAWRARTSVNPYKSTAAIAVDGPFAFSRNPIYLSDVLIYVGLALALNALWSLVLLPLLIWIVQIGVIVREEAYLERRFGEQYLRYKRTVRRWL